MVISYAKKDIEFIMRLRLLIFYAQFFEGKDSIFF